MSNENQKSFETNVVTINYFLREKYPEFKYFLDQNLLITSYDKSTNENLLISTEETREEPKNHFTLKIPFKSFTDEREEKAYIYKLCIANIVQKIMPYSNCTKELHKKLYDILQETTLSILDYLYSLYKIEKEENTSSFFKINNNIDIIKLWCVNFVYLVTVKSFKEFDEWKEETCNLYNLFKLKKNITISIHEKNPLKLVVNNKDNAEDMYSCIELVKKMDLHYFYYTEEVVKANKFKYEIIEINEDSVEIRIE